MPRDVCIMIHYACAAGRSEGLHAEPQRAGGYAAEGAEMVRLRLVEVEIIRFLKFR